MIAITDDGRFESVDDVTSSPAVAGIVHGFVFVAPLWGLVASAFVALAVR